MVRNVAMVMLFITVIAPIVLYTDRLGTFQSSTDSTCKNQFQFCLPLIYALNNFLGSSSAATDEFSEDVTSFVSGIFFIPNVIVYYLWFFLIWVFNIGFQW